MPIYEYQCLNCNNIFEAIRSMSLADAPIKCPNCKNETIKRIVSICFGKRTSTSSGSGSNSCAGCQSKSCANCH